MSDRYYAEQLDEFIDDLRKEHKPGFYRRQEEGLETEKDAELEKMFETVRAVKRVKKGEKSSLYGKFLQSRLFKGTVAAAAAIVLVWGLGIFNFTGVKDVNIVHAVLQAYDELHSYQGVVEIRSEQEGEIDFLETVEIKYQKPLQYFASHSWNDSERHYLSDGEKLAVIEPTRITVDNLFPERELWRYHLGTTIWELEEAAEVNVLGKENLFGRETTVLEYRFAGDEKFHQLWIDESINLPLRKVLNHPEGSRLVVEFKELEVNPSLEEDSFSWELPPGKEIIELNQAITLEEVKDGWSAVEEALEAVPADLELQRAGLMDDVFFEYVLRFRGERERDFMDIYYTSTPLEPHLWAGSQTGMLKKGLVELGEGVWNVFELYSGESNIARWIREDAEIFIVSTRAASQLESTLEKLAGSKINWETVPEKAGEGRYPLYFMEVTATSFQLGREERSFDSPPGARELMEALLQGPRDAGHARAIPERTKLLGVRTENGLAYVDFSAEIAESHYGSEAEGVLLDSIVKTLTQLEKVDAVQILVEGRILDSLGGHFSTARPLP